MTKTWDPDSPEEIAAAREIRALSLFKAMDNPESAEVKLLLKQWPMIYTIEGREVSAVEFLAAKLAHDPLTVVIGGRTVKESEADRRRRLGINASPMKQYAHGDYTADVIVDGQIVRMFIESKNPTDDDLRAFVLAEMQAYAEAIVQMAREHRRTKAGPWLVPG